MNNSCKDCEYVRICKISDDGSFFNGFCKCTGYDLSYLNYSKMKPDWCPIKPEDKRN